MGSAFFLPVLRCRCAVLKVESAMTEPVAETESRS